MDKLSEMFAKGELPEPGDALGKAVEHRIVAELSEDQQIKYWRKLAEQYEAANKRLLKKLNEHGIYL